MRKAKGWFTGYNSNVEGHEEGRTRYFVYNGGTPKYVKTIREVADNNYEGVTLPRMVWPKTRLPKELLNRFIWLGSKFSIFRKKRGIYENRHCHKKHGGQLPKEILS